MNEAQFSILLSLLRMAADLGFTVADLMNKSKEELLAMLAVKEAERAELRTKLGEDRNEPMA